MLHSENSLHTKLCAFLDSEGLVLEGIKCAGSGEVNGDVGTSFDLESKGLNNAFARVVFVRDGIASAQAEGSFPAIERFVILV